jgi:hypothetical protein
VARLVEWVNIKKELYQHVYHQVQQRWGKLGKQILDYRSKYDSESHRKWIISNKEDLFEKMNQSQVIILGDFHSLHQSQKSHLRLIKNFKNLDFKIAVECISFQHQKYLDKYLIGEINDKEFLKKTNWKKNWGFPWEHYEEIFKYAKQKKIKMIALNNLKLMSFKDSLYKRDRVATRIISQELKKSSETIFVIYGESHLTSKKFLNFGERQSKISKLKIFQNIDEIYFQLMDLNREDDVDLVRFTENEFCLLNVPPWVKWQSYLLFLEKKYDSEIESENPDFTDFVDQYIKVISKELKIPCDSKNLSVYTSNDFSFLRKIKMSKSENELKFYEILIEEERSFYIPDLGIGYLGRLTINHAAALAMQYIYFALIKIKSVPHKLPEEFVCLIWIEAVCYFGSKLINPKRKTETIKDIKQKVIQFGSQDSDKEALKLALYQKTKEVMRISGRSFEKNKMIVQKKTSYIHCANLLGSLMGEKLYKGYKAGFISLDLLHSLLRKKMEGKTFEKFYYEFLEIIDNLPESFKSKADRL